MSAPLEIGFFITGVTSIVIVSVFSVGEPCFGTTGPLLHGPARPE